MTLLYRRGDLLHAIFLAQIRPAGYFRVAEEFRELAYAALVA